VSQDWSYLFFKLSLAEALEEIASSITEEAWLNDEYAFVFTIFIVLIFVLIIRSSKIIPSFFVDKASCTRQFQSKLSLRSLAPLFPIKEGSFRKPTCPPLPLREAPPLISDFFNSLYAPFDSPCRGQKPQGRRGNCSSSSLLTATL